MDGKKVLGRGISALIPAQSQAVQERGAGSSDGIRNIAVECLFPGSHQPRTNIDDIALEELAESVRQHGMLHPIIVQAIGDKYSIIAGERRWRAAQLAGFNTVPCMVKNVSDGEGAEIALVENIQRQNLSVLEEAKAYIKLIEEFSYSYEDLAQKLGKSRSHIINTIRITKLPLEVQRLLQERKISAGHARALLAHADPIAAARTIVEHGLSVRDAEKMAKSNTVTNDNKVLHASRPSYPPRRGSSSPEDDIDLAAIERALSGNLGMRVSIRNTLTGGEVVIQFNTVQDLDKVVYKLGQE